MAEVITLTDDEFVLPTPDATGERIHLVVAGAHLSGQPLNHQLVDRDAELVAEPHHHRRRLPALRPRHRATEAGARPRRGRRQAHRGRG